MRIQKRDRPSCWFTEFRGEVYHHDLPGPGEYAELEQLSALRRLDQGITLVTRWNVQTLPSGSPEEQQKAVKRRLGE